MIILDTSGLLAAIDASQRHHQAAAAALRTADGPRLLSPFVLAELDYLIGRRVSRAAARSVLQQVADGAYRLEPMGTDDVAAAAAIIDRYGALELGLADASLVVLAERHGVADILTLDERHFRVVPGPGGRPFHILPADAVAILGEDDEMLPLPPEWARVSDGRPMPNVVGAVRRSRAGH